MKSKLKFLSSMVCISNLQNYGFEHLSKKQMDKGKRRVQLKTNCKWHKTIVLNWSAINKLNNIQNVELKIRKFKKIEIWI